jgi:hypothetical protein
MLHLLGFGASLIVAGLGFIGAVVLSGFRSEAGELCSDDSTPAADNRLGLWSGSGRLLHLEWAGLERQKRCHGGCDVYEREQANRGAGERERVSRCKECLRFSSELRAVADGT